MTARSLCGFLLVSSAFALTGTTAAPGLARHTAGVGSQIPIKMALPAPGGIAVRLLELKVKLKAGRTAPHSLAVKALNRAKLPEDTAVVAAARLLKKQTPGSATYVAMVAVFRAKTTSRKAVRLTASSAATHNEFDFVAFFMPLFGYHPTIDDDSSSELDVHWPAPETDIAFDLSNISYSSTTAFSWSSSTPATSSTGAGTVANDVGQSIYDPATLPELVKEIQQSLDVQFDNQFAEGSLEGASSSSTSTAPATTTAPTTGASAVSLSAYLNGFTGATVNVIAAAGAPRAQVVVLELTGPDVPSRKTVSVEPGQSVPVSLTVPSTACGTWTVQVVSDDGVAVHAGSDPHLKVSWTHAC